MSETVARVAEARVYQVAGPEGRSFELFQTVNRALPETQIVTAVRPDRPAREAIALMKKHGYSQLPVREGDSVLGLFSFRAFALEVVSLTGRQRDAADLPVEEFLEHERATYARLDDEFWDLIEKLDEHDCVMVSGPDDLVAVLTPMDVVRHLSSIAKSFVLLEEIELALRALLERAVAEPEDFARCVENALGDKYEGQPLPTRLVDMTFDDYAALIRDGRNWQRHYSAVFGADRDRARAKLEAVRDIRNDVFHFRRELSDADRGQLRTCQRWLRRCTRKLKAQEASA